MPVATPVIDLSPPPNPWYREPWPWLLFAGPAAAIVAGVVTMAIAVISFDGVVADDYYRQGLAINRLIERDTNAGVRSVAAQVLFNPTGDQVRVTVRGEVDAGLPLRLRLVRAARAGADQDVTLTPIGAGMYEGRLVPPAAGRWHLQLEDSERQWRVSGSSALPAGGAITLAPGLAKAPIQDAP